MLRQQNIFDFFSNKSSVKVSTTSPSVIKVGVIKRIYSPLIKQDVSPQLSLTHFGILFITHSNFQCKNKEEKDFVGSNVT